MTTATLDLTQTIADLRRASGPVDRTGRPHSRLAEVVGGHAQSLADLVDWEKVPEDLTEGMGLATTVLVGSTCTDPSTWPGCHTHRVPVPLSFDYLPIHPGGDVVLRTFADFRLNRS